MYIIIDLLTLITCAYWIGSSPSISIEPASMPSSNIARASSLSDCLLPHPVLAPSFCAAALIWP